MVLEEPPSLDAGEMTDKGTINQKAVLQATGGLVEELYRDRVMNLDDLVAIDVHTHAWKSALAGRRRADRVAGGDGALLPLPAAAPDGAGDGRDVPQAEDGLRRVHRRLAEGASARSPTRRSPSSRTSTPTSRSRSPASTRTAAPTACAWPGDLIKEYGVKGFKFHPSVQEFFPNDRIAYPLYEAIAEAKLPALFHTGQTGVGAGTPRRRRHPPQVLQPDAARRRRGRFPRHADHPRASVVPLAGGGAVGRDAQAAGLHRPLRLVAEVLPADPGAVREHAAQGQDPVRLRLPGDHARSAGSRSSTSCRSSPKCGR